MQDDMQIPVATSPFYQAISAADRAMLAPVLARQYLSAEPVTLSGVMTRVWRRHRWLSPVFRLLAPMKMLFAETGQDVQTALRITPELDKTGRPVQRWERTFSFPAVDRQFDGLVAWDERLGQLIERIGPRGTLESPCRLLVRPGGLRIEATGLRLRVAGRVVRLPKLLGASVLVDQVADPDDVDALSVRLTISHPMLGELFGYEGNLRVSTGAVTSRDEVGQARAVFDRLLAAAPKHPVGMTTDYRTVALLNFAVDPDVIRRLIPHPLDVDVVHDRGFVTVVCADMVRMRPSPLPRPFGITYDQVVYRVPVRYRGEPGLFFLGSDAAQPLMVAAGAAFSMFRVRLSKTRITDAGDRVSIDVFGRRPGVDLHAYLKLDPPATNIPASSAFGSKAEAQSFLVDRFVAFVPGVGGRPMRRVRVKRGTWDVVLPSTTDVRSDLLDDSTDFPAGSAELDSTFVARGIPYRWHAAEFERSPGHWQRPRFSLPD
jgi:uncharacterized protein YqjF (DUF2071 family)